MLPLPRIAMSGPGSCFIFRTSAAMSPLTSRVLLHAAFFMVLEKTTLGILFIPLATSGKFSIAGCVGQKLLPTSIHHFRRGVETMRPTRPIYEQHSIGGQSASSIDEAQGDCSPRSRIERTQRAKHRLGPRVAREHSWLHVVGKKPRDR